MGCEARRQLAITKIEQALQAKLAIADPRPELQSSPVARR
jgi:hypothetical protein